MLKNKAKASGISYQQCLQLFVQEEFLRKLSKSGYDNFLILKGGLFIYTLTNFESRATIDVDFLLAGYENSIDTVKDLICKIIDTPTGNDYITMTAQCFEEISPQRKYHGISTQIVAQIKNVRVPFNIDIGVGDVVVPMPEHRKINTQLPDFEPPIIKTYSLESTIAEKFDAILQRFELTSRMKDFYDIYYLSRTFDFDGAKLQSAIFETLKWRSTPYNKDSFKRIVSLADDEDMQKRWKYFLKTIKVTIDEESKTNIDLDKYGIIIDCTGENSVLDIIQNCNFKKKHIFASVSVGLGAKRLYITLMNNIDFSFSAFYDLIAPYLMSEKALYNDYNLPRNGVGCWHPTFPGRSDDVWLAASTAAKAIENYIITKSEKTISLVYEQRENNGIFEGYMLVDKTEDG